MSRVIAGLLMAVAIVLPASARAAGRLDAYLPKSGVIEGHIMTFSIAPEDEAISRQFRHAVQDHMDWFKKAVTSNGPGQPLPYDRRMGITETQYKQLLRMKSAAKAGEAVKVEVRRAADGSVSLVPGGGAAAAVLADISFPPGENSAKTPVGTLSIVNAIHQTDEAAPIGVWNGVEWAEVADTDAKPSAKIAFGKQASGLGVLYYRISSYDEHKEQSIVVFYKID